MKALEILTSCYILVQGNTVSAMGHFKELKTVRKVILDTMRNIHPIYNIKELMIKRELKKNPELKDEDWQRFLPKFKNRNVKRKKPAKITEKKEYTPFPPEQTLRKEDYQMMSGEYFLSTDQKKEEAYQKKREAKETRKQERIENQHKLFEAPEESSTKKEEAGSSKPDVD